MLDINAIARSVEAQKPKPQQNESGYFDTFGGHFMSGLKGVASGAASFVGLDDWADSLDKSAQESISDVAPSVDPALSWEYISSPGGLTADLGSLLGSEAPFIVASLLTGGAAGAAAKSAALAHKAGNINKGARAILKGIRAVDRAAKEGSLPARLVQGGLFTLPGTFMESATEAGSAVKEARDRNGGEISDEERDEIRNKGLLGNLGVLAPMNMIEVLPFMKMVKGGGKAVQKSLKRRALENLGEAAASALSESYQEGAQQGIQRYALGDGTLEQAVLPNQWHDEQWDEFYHSLGPMMLLSGLGAGHNTYSGHRQAQEEADRQKALEEMQRGLERAQQQQAALIGAAQQQQARGAQARAAAENAEWAEREADAQVGEDWNTPQGITTNVQELAEEAFNNSSQAYQQAARQAAQDRADNIRAQDDLNAELALNNLGLPEQKSPQQQQAEILQQEQKEWQRQQQQARNAYFADPANKNVPFHKLIDRAKKIEDFGNGDFIKGLEVYREGLQRKLAQGQSYQQAVNDIFKPQQASKQAQPKVLDAAKSLSKADIQTQQPQHSTPAQQSNRVADTSNTSVSAPQTQLNQQQTQFAQQEQSPQPDNQNTDNKSKTAQADGQKVTSEDYAAYMIANGRRKKDAYYVAQQTQKIADKKYNGDYQAYLETEMPSALDDIRQYLLSRNNNQQTKGEKDNGNHSESKQTAQTPSELHTEKAGENQKRENADVGQGESNAEPSQHQTQTVTETEEQTLDEAIARGKEAIDDVIRTHKPSRAAMQRGDVGDIDFIWGTKGRGNKFKGGYGLAHIIAKRDAENGKGIETAHKLVEVIAKGDAERQKAHSGSNEDRLKIHYDGYTAILSPSEEDNAWLLTGWEDNSIKKETPASERSEVDGSTTPTTATPTHTRRNGEADVSANNIQQKQETVNKKDEKLKQKEQSAPVSAPEKDAVKEKPQGKKQSQKQEAKQEQIAPQKEKQQRGEKVEAGKYNRLDVTKTAAKKLEAGEKVTRGIINTRKQAEDRLAGILEESSNPFVRMSARATAKIYGAFLEKLVETQKALGVKDASYQKVLSKWGLIVDSLAEDLAKRKPSHGQTRLNQMAGVKALTADLNALKKAEQMRKANRSNDIIFEQTGWLFGADGKPRFYIPDIFDAIDVKKLEEVSHNPGRAKLLSSIYQNPALYEAYPFLKKIKVYAFESKKEKYAGYAEGKKITINLAYQPDSDSEVHNLIVSKDSSNYNEARLTLIHELQHIIQQYEDFAVGGDFEDTALMAKIAGIDPKKITEDQAFEVYENLAGEIEARQAEAAAVKQFNLDEVAKNKGRLYTLPYIQYLKETLTEQVDGAYAVSQEDVDKYAKEIGEDKNSASKAIRSYFDTVNSTVQKLQQMDYQSGGKVAKGAITFSKDGRRVIDVLQNADQSTVAHELAHLFLEEYKALAAAFPNSEVTRDIERISKWAAWNPEQIKEHLKTATKDEFVKRDNEIKKTIAKIKDLKSREAKANTLAKLNPKKHGEAAAQLQKELKDAEARLTQLKEEWAHERFARGFEEYLRTGKAETDELKTVFEKFKEWLTRIYKEVIIGGKFSPEVEATVKKMLGDEFADKKSRSSLANAAKNITDEAKAYVKANPITDDTSYSQVKAIRERLTKDSNAVMELLNKTGLKAGLSEDDATTKAIHRCLNELDDLIYKCDEALEDAKIETEKFDKNFSRSFYWSDYTGAKHSIALNSEERFTQHDIAYHWSKAKQIADADLTAREKLFKDFGQKLGLDVKFFSGVDKFLNGRVNVQTGEMYLNRESVANLNKTFWHETFHSLVANNPQLMRELKAALAVDDAVIDKYRQGREDLKTASNDAVLEEILADNMADSAKRLQLLKDVAAKDRGLVERFVSWIKDLMDKFISVFNNPTGKLTNEQRDNMTRVLAKIAGELKDGNGNKIFKTDGKGNIKLADGKPLSMKNDTFEESNTADKNNSDKDYWRDSVEIAEKWYTWPIRALFQRLGIAYNVDKRISAKEQMTEAKYLAGLKEDVREKVKTLLDEHAEVGNEYLTNQLKRKYSNEVIDAYREAFRLRKKEGEYINPWASWLTSPSRIAEKYPIFKPLFNFAQKAMDLLVSKRNEYFKKYKAALEACGGEKGIDTLFKILLQGDIDGREYTEADLRKGIKTNGETIYASDGVISGYKQMRELMTQVNKELDAARRKLQHFQKRVTLEEYELLKDNKFVTINEYDAKTGEIDYDEARNYEKEYKGISEAKLNQLKANTDRVQILSEEEIGEDKNGKLYDVKTREGLAPLADKKGYIPHFFHSYMVRVNDENGRILGSARNLNDALLLAEKEKGKLTNGEEIVICEKTFDFEALGMNEAQAAVVMGDKDYHRMTQALHRNGKMTVKEAQQLMSESARKTGRRRSFGSFLHRKGAQGYVQDMGWVLEHHLTMASRYIAMETEFKPQAIAYFEKTFGAFDKEYSGMAKFAKEYINDVNGTPSALEETINKWLNKQGWWKNFFGAIWGDRAAVYLSNSIASKIAVAKLGFLNLSSGLVNLTQSMNVAGYLGDPRAMFRVWQMGVKKYSPAEQALLDKAHVNEDIDMTSVSGYDQRRSGKGGFLSNLGDKSMYFFSKAERILRRGTILVAYEHAKKNLKMDDAKALQYAIDINNKSNFDYSVADAPNVFRRGSILSTLFLQFKKYPIKELEVMRDMISAHTSKAQKATFWGTYFLLGGLFQLPFSEWVDENILETWFGRSYKREIKSLSSIYLKEVE